MTIQMQQAVQISLCYMCRSLVEESIAIDLNFYLLARSSQLVCDGQIHLWGDNN